jgi:cytochrome oxidase Cu insertion factor (SCO1/SenC/PrrC family)
MRLALVAVLLLASFSSGCGGPPAQPADDFGPLPDFTLTERSGRALTRADLRGRVWVASFTFTRCAGACWQISETMSRLQKDFANAADFRLVSISVDPAHDTPAVQQCYADQKGADAARWLFLTGEQEPIYRLIGEGFKLTVYQTEGADRKPGFEVEHTPKVAVVDRRGHVRGYFDGRHQDEQGQPINDYPALQERVRALLREKP